MYCLLFYFCMHLHSYLVVSLFLSLFIFFFNSICLFIYLLFMYLLNSYRSRNRFPVGSLGIFSVVAQKNRVPWGRLSPWKWVRRNSTEVKAAGACGWRPTTLVVPKVRIIRCLNLLETHWATSVCRGTLLPYLPLLTIWVKFATNFASSCPSCFYVYLQSVSLAVRSVIMRATLTDITVLNYRLLHH